MDETTKGKYILKDESKSRTMLKAHQYVKWCLGERNTDYQGQRSAMWSSAMWVFQVPKLLRRQRIWTERCSLDSGAGGTGDLLRAEESPQHSEGKQHPYLHLLILLVQFLWGLVHAHVAVSGIQGTFLQASSWQLLHLSTRWPHWSHPIQESINLAPVLCQFLCCFTLKGVKGV